MAARIVMDDGGGPVVGSITLDAADLGATVTLSNQDDTGVLGWKWEMLDAPDDSATYNPLPAPVTTATTTVTPDTKGESILMRLTTYKDAGRTQIDAIDQKLVRVKFDPPYDWVIPAAGETVEADIIRGWARAVNRTLRDIWNFVKSGGSGGNRPLNQTSFYDAANTSPASPADGSVDNPYADTGTGSGVKLIAPGFYSTGFDGPYNAGLTRMIGGVGGAQVSIGAPTVTFSSDPFAPVIRGYDRVDVFGSFVNGGTPGTDIFGGVWLFDSRVRGNIPLPAVIAERTFIQGIVGTGSSDGAQLIYAENDASGSGVTCNLGLMFSWASHIQWAMPTDGYAELYGTKWEQNGEDGRGVLPSADDSLVVDDTTRIRTLGVEAEIMICDLTSAGTVLVDFDPSTQPLAWEMTRGVEWTSATGTWELRSLKSVRHIGMPRYKTHINRSGHLCIVRHNYTSGTDGSMRLSTVSGADLRIPHGGMFGTFYAPTGDGDVWYAFPLSDRQRTIVVHSDFLSGDAESADELMALITQAPGPCRIILAGTGPSLTFTSGTYDLQGSTFECAADTTGTVTIAPGATVQNCGGFYGSNIQLSTNTSIGTPSLAFTSSSARFAIDLANVNNIGSGPMIVVPDGSFFTLDTREAVFSTTGGAFVKIGAGSGLIWVQRDNGDIFPNNAFTDSGTGTIIWKSNGCRWSPQAGFSGTLISTPLNNNAGSGPTAMRPTTPKKGQTYYDETISKFIVYDGSAWVRTNGNTGQLVLACSGGFASTTNGCTQTQHEETTNKVNYISADFAQSAQSYFEWDLAMPADWDGGTIDAMVRWLAPSASTNAVVWGFQGRVFASGSAIDQAFGTAVEVTQANAGNGLVNEAAIAAVTLAGSANPGHVQFRLYRLGSGADNLAAVARALGVEITYGRK